MTLLQCFCTTKAAFISTRARCRCSRSRFARVSVSSFVNEFLLPELVVGPPRFPPTLLKPIVVSDGAFLALLLEGVPPTLLLSPKPPLFFPDKSIFFCLVELPSNECNPGINDIMSIYYLRVCSLSLFLSLSLVRSLSLSLVVRKACKVRRKKFRNSDAFFFAKRHI